MKTQHPDPRRNLVGFAIGEVRYAVGVELVRQVINPMPTTPLPHMPGAIVGVAEHRGVVIPIVDLRLQFGFKPEVTRRTKWILLDLQGDVVGIVVDLRHRRFRCNGRPSPSRTFPWCQRQETWAGRSGFARRPACLLAGWQHAARYRQAGDEHSSARRLGDTRRA